MTEGRKDDSGKPDWSLLPMDSIEEIVQVLTFGAQKYARDNWQKVADFDNRYYAAAMRHLAAWRTGQDFDDESGLSHLAHAATCLVFLLHGGERNND